MVQSLHSRKSEKCKVLKSKFYSYHINFLLNKCDLVVLKDRKRYECPQTCSFSVLCLLTSDQPLWQQTIFTRIDADLVCSSSLVLRIHIQQDRAKLVLSSPLRLGDLFYLTLICACPCLAAGAG